MADMKLEPKITVSAIIVRSDGTIEDLGVVAESDNTPETVTPLKRRD